MTNEYHSVVLLATLFISSKVVSQTISDAKNLRTDIFITNSYDAKVRPVDNQSLAVDVYVAFYLLNLNELNEIEETMKTTGFLHVTWADEQMDWTPASYGGITESYWPQGDIWKPDIALKNSYTQYQPLGDSSLNVHVNNDGTVVWQPFQVFVSTCSMSTRYYPFDEQKCEMEFVAWSYTKAEVFMQGDNKRGIDLSYYEPSPTWDIIDTSWNADFSDVESSITFKITLKRKPLHAIVTIVFPLLLLSLLNILAFLLPCDGGEKSGYAVTIFLAFVVFLTIVETTLPPSSESIAPFSVYILLMTIMSTTITIIVVIENRCNAWDVEEVSIPAWVKFLADVGRLKLCRNSCGKVDMPSGNKVEDLREKGHSSHVGLDEDISEVDTEKEYDWKTVIYGIDRFCILIFSVFTILCTFLFLLIMSVVS